MVTGPTTARFDLPLRRLSRVETAFGILLVGLTYASVAAVALLVAIAPGYASALWPPAGIALAACLAYGGRLWPGIVLGAAIANFGVLGTPAVAALAVGAGNAAEAVLAALLVRRYAALGQCFDHPAAVWKFAGIAFVAPLVAATNGVAMLALAGQVPWTEIGAQWLTWWLGDATGIVIVTPLLLCWGAARDAGTGRVRRKAVTAASFVLSLIAVADLLDGSSSLFPALTLNQSLLLTQLVVTAVALAGLAFSAYADELWRLRSRLAATQARLDRALAEPAEREASEEGRVRLNSREREILALLAEGLTSSEVAHRVHLSPRTIESYRTRLMEKLDVPNFAQLIQYAVRHGLVSRKS